MQERRAGFAPTRFRGLIAEAWLALARLDASRLQELALACQAFQCGLSAKSAEERTAAVEEIRAAAGEMAILGRVLEATRGNLRVMERLRELAAERIEYTEAQARGWAAEARDGHD